MPSQYNLKEMTKVRKIVSKEIEKERNETEKAIVYGAEKVDREGENRMTE